MKKHKLDKQLWEQSTGKTTYLLQESGLVALAFCVDVAQRLPEEGFAVHSVPEAFVVLSGEISIGTQAGLETVPAGTLAIIDANEEHYTLNQSGHKATLVAFSLSDS